MRISFLLSSLQLSGGVQVIIEYANRLSARGHTVTLVAPAWDRSSEASPTRAQAHRARRPGHGAQDASSQAMLDQIAPGVTVRTSKVERPIRRQITGWNLAYLTLSMACAVPHSDIVIATHTPTTAVSLLACHLMRRGRPVWFFMDYKEMFAGRPCELWLMRYARRWHRLVLVLSRDSQCELGAHDAVLVGLGLSHAEHLRPRSVRSGHREAEHQTSGRKRSILYLGDARPRKGLSDLLRGAQLACERVEGIELWIASKKEIEIESTVPFRQLVRPTPEELAELYATCDLFVSTSWREGFGLPPLEAMACGAPVVLTDSGGVREYARHGENCLIVPAQDATALAEAMIRVLTEPALARQLRDNGPITAARFTWESAVDRCEEALGRLLETKAPKPRWQRANGGPGT